MARLILILGLALWASAHLFRAVAPGPRAVLDERFGPGSKGLFALAIFGSLIVIWLGYRATPFVSVWTPPSFFTHINNLMMLVAFYMYLTTATKPGTAFIFGNLKNPQLSGFKVWAAAHLLVNGDLAAILLFVGLAAWAVAEVIAAKHSSAEPLVNRASAPISSPWVHLALAVAAFALVSALHIWLGRWPFG
ncbi:MAG: NnrU family protein [Pseudomonadota bacterium]